MTLARVAVIATGGTISSVGRDTLDVWEYMDHSTRLEADEIVAAVSEVASVADVVPVRHRAISSAAIAPTDWLALWRPRPRGAGSASWSCRTTRSRRRGM